MLCISVLSSIFGDITFRKGHVSSHSNLRQAIYCLICTRKHPSLYRAFGLCRPPCKQNDSTYMIVDIIMAKHITRDPRF